MRRAATSYWVKESIRRLRTLEASDSWELVGGLSGSLLWDVRSMKSECGQLGLLKSHE